MLNNKKTKKEKTEEEKKIVEELKEAIEKEEETAEEDELTPVEELSCRVAGHLAFMAAERFEPIADEMGMEAAKKIVMRIEISDYKTAVRMLQALFLAKGMVHAAEDLDILDNCEEYDSDAYFIFVDSLFDTDIFDWYSIENLFDEFRKDGPEEEGDREVDIWETL